MLSCLHRLGVTAALTLGNKKGVDILVAGANGKSIMVEVKGVARHYDWPANNIDTEKIKGTNAARRFVVLVSFKGTISDLTMPTPEVWVVPFSKLKPFTKLFEKSGRTNVQRALVTAKGDEYRNAWNLIK